MTKTGLFATGLCAVLLASALGLSGCHNIRYSTRLPPNGVEHTEWNHFFLFGLVGQKEVNLSRICNGRVSRVRTYMSFVNALVTIFPGLGGLLWSPRTLEVQCSSGATATLEVDEDGRVTAAHLRSSKGCDRRIAFARPLPLTDQHSQQGDAR